jgi:tetratricopeptide (TPR) repeat protein
LVSQVTKGINGLTRCYKTADARLTDLGAEVTSLQSLLHTVKRTFAPCRNLSLAGAEEDYWHQSELSILDCQVTLGELGTLVNKIKDNAAGKSFGWKMRATLDLSVYGPDIATAREKVNKSHWALQTMLHTVNVSLSIQNNSSAQDISFKLDRLKSSIDEALRVALKAGSHDFGQSHASESHVARNLRNLAEAAKHFHSAASSAASSKASSAASSGGDSGVAGLRQRNHRPQPNEHDAFDPSTLLGPSSLLGDFPTSRREWVEEWQRKQPNDQASDIGTPARVASPSPSSTISAPAPRRPTHRPHVEIPVIEEEEDDEAEFEKMFLDGLEDLARDSIRVSDFDKAIELLTEAIRREEKTSSNKEDFRRLQTQLALCHLFQGDASLAEPIVDALARSSPARGDGELDQVVWTLMHVLAVTHLGAYAFDKALKLCKKALQGRKRFAKKSGVRQEEAGTCSDSTGLLATIYQMKGDYIAAEIYRRQIPTDCKYEHPAFPLEYLISRRELLEDVLGDDLPDICEPVTVQSLPGSHELVGSLPEVSAQAMPRRQTLRRRRTTNGGDMSPLRTRRHQWEKFESDTSKEVLIAPTASETDADDEASSLAPSSDEPTETIPTRPMRPTEQPGHGIRRRMTTIFVKRRRMLRDDESSDSEQSPVTTSPLRRWFLGSNIFGKSRPTRQPRLKAVLRKNVKPLVRSEAMLRPFGRKAPQTFRQLRMNIDGRYEDVSSPSSPQSSKDQLATLRWLPAELDSSGYSLRDRPLDNTPASPASGEELRQKLVAQDCEKDYM